jgi:threonine/homoserine/homoserine lactone efflux protein
MNYGVRKCIWSAFGDVTANFIQAVLVIFVIGSFFSENSIILNIFKWVGVFYILYLAYDIFRSRPKNLTEKNIIKKSNLSFFKDGFLVAGTSPKAWMFFPFIFPQFIDFNSNLLTQFVILITSYIVLDFLSLIGYAMLAQKLIKWITANPKTINTISASVLVIIAVIIVVSQRY